MIAIPTKCRSYSLAPSGDTLDLQPLSHFGLHLRSNPASRPPCQTTSSFQYPQTHTQIWALFLVNMVSTGFYKSSGFICSPRPCRCRESLQHHLHHVHCIWTGPEGSFFTFLLSALMSKISPAGSAPRTTPKLWKTIVGPGPSCSVTPRP